MNKSEAKDYLTRVRSELDSIDELLSSIDDDAEIVGVMAEEIYGLFNEAYSILDDVQIDIG